MYRTGFLLLMTGWAFTAAAQPIERVKITDNDMSCRQIHDEIGAMDKTIGEAKAKQAEGETATTAAQAGGVAAEVASRTGLFAQVGGLFGHIAGTVAAKTAAGVAEQSGQKNVQAAKEREQQALGRKEHLTALFLAKGCKASDPDAPAANPAAGIALPAPAAAATLPVEEVIKQATANLTPATGELQINKHRVGEKHDQPRVFIPNFRVAFVVKTVAQAHAGSRLANLGNTAASPFGVKTITQAQNKRVEMALAGADEKLLQALTDKLYEDFIARLKAAGREVVPWEEIKKTAGYDKIKLTEAKPYLSSPWAAGDKRDYLVLTPSGMPLFFTDSSLDSYLGDRIGDLDTSRAVAELAARLNATAMIPTLQIDIAEVHSSGNSNWGSDAEAELKPKLGIVNGSQLFLSNGEDKKLFFIGEVGILRLEKPWYLDGEIGAVRVVDKFDTAALANALTAVTGAQGVQSFSEKRELRVAPLKFASGVMKVGALFNEKMIAAARP